jgi:hypothetical protein
MEIHWSYVAIVFTIYIQIHMEETHTETIQTCPFHLRKEVLEEFETSTVTTFLLITTPTKQLEIFPHNK